MSKSITIGIPLIVILLLCSCVVLSAKHLGLFGGEPQPRIHVRNPFINVGTIRGSRGPKVTAFEIENVGKAPLVITKVRGSCPCLKLSLDRHTLLPGETASLSAAVSVPATPGKWDDTIILSSNDPRNPTTKLKIEGNAELECFTVPHFISVNGLEYGNTREVAFEIFSPSNDESFKPLGMSADTDAIKIAELKEVADIDAMGRKRWKARFTVDYRGIASWQGKIIVSTSDPNGRDLKVPVSVKEIPLLRIAPRAVFLRQSAKSPKPTAAIEISSNRQEMPLTISEIRSPDWLKVTDNTDPTGGSVQLSVEILPNLIPNRNSIGGKITVTFEQDEPPAEIPILVLAQE